MPEVLLLTVSVLTIYSLYLAYSIRQKIYKGLSVDLVDKLFVTAFCLFVFAFSISLFSGEGTGVYWGKAPQSFITLFLWFSLLVYIFEHKMIWHSKSNKE
tara:strand:- start:562 stop:861 length:300 start_codon:yes stop_codon:yes gene_type:complete